jgi:hypothetical protein
VIYTQDDLLYITDSTGMNIKSSIKNLYNGNLVQDRSEPDILFCVDNEKDRIHRVNLFNLHPTSIPYNLMIKDDLFTRYDGSTLHIDYFESIDKSEAHQILSHLKLRTWLNSVIDFRHEYIMVIAESY